ncbi:fatty acid desaturase [Parasphingopyxis marina]|uniref:Fatty acid desaturase n=1 Tax=Parasphingopyxis marina TaxID=2761622 RepID=A0A842HZZ1_9SPHN|nr:fatty acid desaturase [Parasphingopyxis marina]MBC2777500.1 fatty acid desaturase [Parasphingopyxis marina]
MESVTTSAPDTATDQVIERDEARAGSAPENKELIRAEQAVAGKYIGGVAWTPVIWGLGNLAVWLSLWPLVFLDILPLWAAFPIATVNVAASYLPAHEAMHDIIARRGSRLHWLNELVGHLSMIPLILPYRVARLTHLEHHRHTNKPGLDPDYEMHGSGPVNALWRHFRNRQPGSTIGLRGYPEVLKRLGRPEVVLDGIAYQLVFYGILCALAWNGFGIEAVLLWWLPRHIGSSYVLFFLSWAPHHTNFGTGRYGNTRAWKSRLGNIGSMGMQFHIVHHLYPNIPITRTPAAYREMKPLLEARGCDLGTL